MSIKVGKISIFNLALSSKIPNQITNPKRFTLGWNWDFPTFINTFFDLYRVRQSFRESYKLQYSERIIASTQKQTLHQQKALDFSFKMAPWKWAWHYQEGVKMTYCKRTFFTPRAPMLFAARGRDALLIMPRPLSGCQIKAEIKGFLLRYRLFLYY